MKKYLKQLGTFLSVITILTVGFYIINIFIFDKVHHAFYNQKQINTIILGDSHLQHLSEKAIPHSLNLSQPGDPYPVMYFKLKETIKHNNPRSIVLALSYNNITYHSDIKFLHYSELVINRLYPIIKIHPHLCQIKRKKIALSTYLRRLFTPNIDYFSMLFSSGSITELPFYSYRPTSTYPKLKKRKTLRVDKKKLKERTDLHFNFKNKRNRLGNVSLEYLNKIVELCHTENIEIFFLNMPLHKSYKDMIPYFYKSNFESIIDGFKKEYTHVNFINYVDLFDDRDNLFVNSDHVSKRGALVVSRKLSRKVK